jgi:hypothetical protein
MINLITKLKMGETQVSIQSSSEDVLRLVSWLSQLKINVDSFAHDKDTDELTATFSKQFSE